MELQQVRRDQAPEFREAGMELQQLRRDQAPPAPPVDLPVQSVPRRGRSVAIMDGECSDTLKSRNQLVMEHLRRVKDLTQQLQLQLKVLDATSSLDECRRLTAEIAAVSDRSISLITDTGSKMPYSGAPVHLSDAGLDEQPFCGSPKKPKANPSEQLDASSDEKPFQDDSKKPKAEVPLFSLRPAPPIPLSDAGSDEKPFQDSPKKPKLEVCYLSQPLQLPRPWSIPLSDAGSDEKKPFQECPKKPKAELPWLPQQLALPPQAIPLGDAGSDENPSQEQDSPKKAKATPWWFSQQLVPPSASQHMSAQGEKSSNSSSMSTGGDDDISKIVDDEDAGIVRRSSEKRDIMELVMSQEPRNKRVTIICITGGHGIGKTYLASLVYWDDIIFRCFEARAWLCFSDACDYEEILRSVIASLTGVSCWLNELDELEGILKEEVMGKKVLLVLDNLCQNNVEVCRQLLSLLSLGDKGSAVIVTVNKSFIAEQLGATLYNLKPLSYDSFVFLAKPASIEYSSLRNIISKMPSGCSGYPMFAKAIHGILYLAFAWNSRPDDTFESKLTEIFGKPDNHLHHLLYLSYSYLLPHQKMCLLYCSMFPRDYTYNKERLLRLWMSQGFIIPEREKNGHGNCEDEFDELLHGPFFTYSPLSEAMEQKYVMHELPPDLADLARHASGNTFFRAHDHELHCIPKDVLHLSIIPKNCELDIDFRFFKQIRDLRTFLLVHNSNLESSQFHVFDVKALDECFRNFSCLYTLDLSHTDIKELPESIGYITSLRFLGLNNTNIRKLPDSVCNLFNLQTLELQNSEFLDELPKDMKNLNNLYHLDASKEYGPIYVPPGIGQMTNLRTLTTFTVGGVSWNCKVSELEHLNSLKGFLHIQNLNNVENAEEAKGACLAAKKLRKLSLEWCHIGEDVFESGNYESDKRMSIAKDVIEGLKPHNLLGELSITGYYGNLFPSWIDHSFTDLVSITLDNCYNCLRLPPLGTLSSLRFLFIQNLRGVRLINFEFCGFGLPVTRTNDMGFPKLEVMRLRDMYNLEFWYDVVEGDYPSLRSLSLERCPKLKSIPRFQWISDISVMSCSKLNLPGLQSLQSLKIGYLRQRVCFALPFELCSLVMLEVVSCEHLSSLEGLSQLQSLKHLKFRTCPRLNFIQDEAFPDTLETVDIHTNCYALSMWRPNGFEEIPDASEVYRKFVRHKCEAKGVDDAVMHDSMSH